MNVPRGMLKGQDGQAFFHGLGRHSSAPNEGRDSHDVSPRFSGLNGFIGKASWVFGFEIFSFKNGGEGGIRTPVTIARKSDFESDAFDHSATSPGVLLCYFLFKFKLADQYLLGLLTGL